MFISIPKSLIILFLIVSVCISGGIFLGGKGGNDINYQRKIDSLESVIYSQELELSRYEITLERLKEEDPPTFYLFKKTMDETE